MISDKNFLDFINDKSLDLSENEIKNIIDKELEKPENKTDADLIEFCLDALSKIEGKEIHSKAEKRSKFSLKKAIIAAAAAIILVSGAVTASAGLLKFNIASELVEYFGNYLEIKQEGGTQNADSYSLTGSALAQELDKNGISPVTLPEALLNQNYTIESITYQIGDVSASADVIISNTQNETLLNITKYSKEEYIPDVDVMYPKKGTHYQINGLDIFVIEVKRAVTAYYADGLTTYLLVFDCSYEDANKIIQTIR